MPLLDFLYYFCSSIRRIIVDNENVKLLREMQYCPDHPFNILFFVVGRDYNDAVGHFFCITLSRKNNTIVVFLNKI